MKTFQQFQEDMNKKVPPVIGLGGGGGGTDSITAKSSAKSLKKRVGDVGKILTRPFRKVKKDPTEKFATEGVASLALKGGSKLIPALMTGIGAAGTYLQTRRGRPEGGEAKRYKRKNPNKKRKLSRIQQKMIDLDNKKGANLTNPADKVQNKIRTTEPKDRVNIDSPRTKSDDVLINPSPGEARKEFNLLTKYLKKQRSVQGNTYLKKKGIEEEMAPTNNASSGNIAGLPPDNPPVKKKKKYIYGGRGSRKMWMS